MLRFAMWLSVLIAIVAAVLIGLLLPSARQLRAQRLDPAHDPLAVALLQTGRGSELVVIDLERFRVAHRVRLRSLCLSIDGDPETRLIATAQCGGPDRSADNALGVYDAASGDPVRYVDLGVPNPANVAVSGGRAVVVHGFETAGGLLTSEVDLSGGARVRRGTIARTALRPERSGRAIMLGFADASGPADAADPARVAGGSVGRLGSASRVETLTALAASTVTIAASESPEGRAIVAYREASSDEWRVARIQSASHSIEATAALPDVERGIFEGCEVGSEVAFADADGIDLSTPGHTVHVLDSQSLKLTRRLVLDGMPAALRSWGDRLLVFDGVTGDLLVFERGATACSQRLTLGGSPQGTGDLVVFDRRR